MGKYVEVVQGSVLVWMGLCYPAGVCLGRAENWHQEIKSVNLKKNQYIYIYIFFPLRIKFSFNWLFSRVLVLLGNSQYSQEYWKYFQDTKKMKAGILFRNTRALTLYLRWLWVGISSGGTRCPSVLPRKGLDCSCPFFLNADIIPDYALRTWADIWLERALCRWCHS